MQYSRFSCSLRDCMLTEVFNISGLSECIIRNTLDPSSIKDFFEIQGRVYLTWSESKIENTLFRIKNKLSLGRCLSSSDLKMEYYLLDPLNEIVLWVCFLYGDVLTVWTFNRTCFYPELYCVLAFWPQAQYLTLLELSFFYIPKGDNPCPRYLHRIAVRVKKKSER